MRRSLPRVDPWRGPRRTVRPLVLRVQSAADVRIEGADRSPDLLTADRIAVLAHWDDQPLVRRSPGALIDALQAAGFVTLFVSAAEGPGSLQWVHGRPASVTVLRRPNLGHDFGSWATALEWFPEIRGRPTVLLMNDSLAGPFASVDRLFGRLDRSQADVWAMTDTSQLQQHLQSYCLAFRGGCLESTPLRGFWQGIRVEASRDDVIQRYELGLSRLLRRFRFSTDVAIEGWRVVDADDNPTIFGWRRLLDLGFPFVKRQLLREPGICPDGFLVRDELWRRFGIEADEWS